LSKDFAYFEKLVKTISVNTGLKEEDIAIKAGRNRGYISQLRSRYKSKGEEAPEKFIELLHLRFAKEKIPEIPAPEDKKDEGNSLMASLIQANLVNAKSIEKLTDTNQALINEKIKSPNTGNINYLALQQKTKELALYLQLFADALANKYGLDRENVFLILGSIVGDVEAENELKYNENKSVTGS
jgi:hypothetical protein